MRKQTGLTVLCISAFVGCNKTSEPAHDTHTHGAPVVTDEKTPTQGSVTPIGEATRVNPARYGEPIREPVTTTVTIADVVAQPDAFKDRSVVIEGEVRRSCTNMGCWMELAPTMSAATGARVTFKDYGFFIPTDAQGAHARIQGTVGVKTLSAADVVHMESEGGTVQGKLADGTAKELGIVASGVELWRG